MKIDNEIVALATERLDRKHGPRLQAPSVPSASLSLWIDRQERVARYVNENRMPDDTAALERAFGTNDLVSLNYFWSGIRAARSVGMIRISPGPGDPGGREPVSQVRAMRSRLDRDQDRRRLMPGEVIGE